MHNMYKYVHSYGIVAIDSVVCTHSMILHQPRNIKRQGTVAATRLDITLRLLTRTNTEIRLSTIASKFALLAASK